MSWNLMRWNLTAAGITGFRLFMLVTMGMLVMMAGPVNAQSPPDLVGNPSNQTALSNDALILNGAESARPFSGGSDRFSTIEPRPSASPVAPVDSDGVVRQATFDIGRPMAMAAFVRDTALWLVFATERPLDAAMLARQGELGFGTSLIADARGGVALRFDNEAGQRPSISRDGAAWTVTLPVVAPVVAPDVAPSLVSVVELGHPDGARLFLDAAGAIRPVAFIDPVIGDILVAMPLAVADQGVDLGRRFVEFDLLPSMLGIVIRPLVDDIRVRPVDGGVAITSESGLQLS